MLWGVLQRIFYMHITSGKRGDDFQTHHGHGVVPRKTNYLISQLTNQQVMKTQTNLTNTSFGQRITGNQKMESYETWAWRSPPSSFASFSFRLLFSDRSCFGLNQCTRYEWLSLPCLAVKKVFLMHLLQCRFYIVHMLSGIARALLISFPISMSIGKLQLLRNMGFEKLIRKVYPRFWISQ